MEGEFRHAKQDCLARFAIQCRLVEMMALLEQVSYFSAGLSSAPIITGLGRVRQNDDLAANDGHRGGAGH